MENLDGHRHDRYYRPNGRVLFAQGIPRHEQYFVSDACCLRMELRMVCVLRCDMILLIGEPAP